ncbi:hypothetical protein Taro_043682 [Colocasia esculenta]|uniref:Uncharacterized protein n=1 Tax=Colocasia esculenta TaxID=4460 RepID=A0A843WK11_COLES|nr:hypothetical protein [Colocasia esculenta]
MKNWSSSVDPGYGSVDTRDSSQNTFWAIWDSSVDTRSGSVDTRDVPRTPSGLYWDSVSTLVQVVSTLVPFQGKTYRSRVTCKHIAADTTGKKNDLVWMISFSPATKNFSTRPQQVLKLIPRKMQYADRSRHNREEERLSVDDLLLPSHQELLHTTPVHYH